MTFLDNSRKIYVAGANGMVGSAICRLIESNNFSKEKKIILKTTRNELDLTNQNHVENWFCKNQPDVVIIAAAKVGGIMANQSYPVQFLLENLKIQNNLIEASYKNGVKRLVFLGSSCIYPKFSEQPIKEEYLLTNSLEETNQCYAIAKIAGLKLCDAYRRQYDFDAISLMPTNLFGPKDNYDSKNSHVMAALIRKFYEAKRNNLEKVVCWGSGNPLREFLYVEDFAEASLFCLNNWFPDQKNSPKDSKGNSLSWLNVGSDYEISIKELAEKISKIIDYRGKIIWDETKPDGTPRKKLDNTNIYKLGWVPKTSLDCGIRKTIKSYEEEFCCKYNS
tara:strand:+ start:1620 stop:2624 length:1005 start_codon:yes stop_codon:yes gene_type:complete